MPSCRAASSYSGRNGDNDKWTNWLYNLWNQVPKKTHTDKERTCKHAPQFRCFYIYQDYVTCGKEPTWVCVSVLHRKIDFFIQSRRHFETSNISFHNKHLSRLTKLTAPPTHKQPPTHNLLESHSILGSCSVWRQSSALFTVISWQHKLSVQCWQGASQWLHTLQENVATNKRFYDHVYAKMVGRKTWKFETFSFFIHRTFSVLIYI